MAPRRGFSSKKVRGTLPRMSGFAKCFAVCSLLFGFVRTSAAQQLPPPAPLPADPNGQMAGTYEQPPSEYDEAAYQALQGQAQYGYAGAHPIPHEVGSGFCTIQGPHFHDYAPFDQYLFREVNGYYYFTGDVSDFGYAAQTWGFNGNHPIPAADGGGFCYNPWPHRHFYAPWNGAAFNLVSGYYVYAGPWSPAYFSLRPRYLGYYNNYYRPTYFGRRYYVAKPRPLYRPRVVWGAPGVYRRGPVVVAPRVVAPPRPVRVVPGRGPGFHPGRGPGFQGHPGGPHRH